MHLRFRVWACPLRWNRNSIAMEYLAVACVTPCPQSLVITPRLSSWCNGVSKAMRESNWYCYRLIFMPLSKLKQKTFRKSCHGIPLIVYIAYNKWRIGRILERYTEFKLLLEIRSLLISEVTMQSFRTTLKPLYFIGIWPWILNMLRRYTVITNSCVAARNLYGPLTSMSSLFLEFCNVHE